MPRTRPPYPQKFRDQIIELARTGRTPSDLADEFEPTETTIRNSSFAARTVNFGAYQDWRRQGTPGDGMLDETTFHYRYLRSEENDEGFSKDITTLSEKRFKEIKDSEALFARKFNTARSEKLMEMIDHQLLS